MRPNKPINSGAHRSGVASRRGKSRYFAADLPSQPAGGAADRIVEPQPSPASEPVGKYHGRASVGPWGDGDDAARTVDPAEVSGTEDWVDPLDDDKIDLTRVTIDLRETLVESPPDTYYQRHSSRVPGHQ